jgi:hypothetical protein
MNPICPKVNTPVKPLARLRLTVRTMKIASVMARPCQ